MLDTHRNRGTTGTPREQKTLERQVGLDSVRKLRAPLYQPTNLEPRQQRVHCPQSETAGGALLRVDRNIMI